MSSDFADEFGENQDDIELTPEFLAGVPKPLYWRVVVMPINPKAVSKGGIAIPQVGMEAQKYQNYMGRVVAVGESAGRHERFHGRKDGSLAKGFPQVGEYAIYGKYHHGQRMTYKGTTLIVLNDDELLCTDFNPDNLAVHI